MNNFGKNAMGGLLGAIYLMCFAFPIGLVMDVFRDHMPIGQFLANQVITFLAVWFVGYFFVQMYREMLANANKPRSDDDDGKTANKTDNKNDINADGKTSNKTDDKSDDSNDKQ